MLALVLVASRLAQAEAPMSHDGQHEPDAPIKMAASPLGVSEAQWGSGTAWQPGNSPMYGLHLMPGGGWLLMLHWNAFGGYDAQRGPRGDRALMSTNWVMAMATHDVAGGQFGARVMLSAEPFTATARGYPLLLQSGEEYMGQPLHDRQHPHDLFMEVALQYLRRVADDVAILVYVAPAGEPALGPVAFPHRASAIYDPLAPITHHWLDSTHISFGVLTGGIYGRRWKVDGSWFNGREPDEHRYDFDLRRPDSGAGRLSVNPTDAWSAQVSYGYLASPEAHETSETVHRITASTSFGRSLWTKGYLAATAAWGRNIPSSRRPSSDGVLLEVTASLNDHDVIFGRAEYVRKSALDLSIPVTNDETQFDVLAVALGDFPPVGPLVLGLGARGAIGVVPPSLETTYGTRTPLGGMVFIHLRPPRMGVPTRTDQTPHHEM